MTYWPDEWRSALADAFDAAARPLMPEVLVIVVGNDGRYTGEVLRMGAGNQWEYDPTLAGQYAEGVTVRDAEAAAKSPLLDTKRILE